MFTKDSRILNNRLTVPLTSVSKAVGDVFKPTLDQLIKHLFANNEQGFAYDPNDLSTMYQDAAGTVPVTGAGQSVGLILDKSKGVTYSENLSNTGKQQALFSQIALNDGWWDITRTTSNFPGISQTDLETNSLYKVKVSWKTTSNFALRIEFGSTSGFAFQTIYGVGIGTWEGYVNSLDKTQLNVYFRDVVNAGYYGSVKIDSIQKIAGNHALQTTSASRPILRKNAVTGANYLEFDGYDDFLQTNNIDFTATDKVSLFAGVRKLSDAVTGMLVELSNSADINNSAFYIVTPFNTTTAFRFYTKGSNGGASASVSPPSAYAGQTSVVLSIKSQMVASPQINLRVNQDNYQGVNIAALGNYGNYPLYIGRRGGSVYPFNGHLYGLIGVGKLASDSETAAIEKELAKRAGVTLSV